MPACISRDAYWRKRSDMANKYRGRYCSICKKQRNLAWDPKKERCYDCIIKEGL